MLFYKNLDSHFFVQKSRFTFIQVWKFFNAMENCHERSNCTFYQTFDQRSLPENELIEIF